jgi:hypothetical protein
MQSLAYHWVRPISWASRDSGVFSLVGECILVQRQNGDSKRKLVISETPLQEVTGDD